MVVFFYVSGKLRLLELKGDEETHFLGKPAKETADKSASPDAVAAHSLKNTPPEIKGAKLQLDTKDNADILRIIAEGNDKDGDAVTFKYEWSKNNELYGEGDSITGFKRGDNITVKAAPFDGKEYGQFRIFSMDIKNSTPKIIDMKETKFDGKLFSYQMRAADPDGDPLTFSLLTAPQGMS
ncbi:MAG: hypothetical protein L0Y62_04620, partial [Nitrospirae bacterium]|nr:hypothetical protein [Nitrospirota bacterium]